MSVLSALADRLAESHRLRAEPPSPPPARRVTGWTVTVTCLACDSPVEHVTGSHPSGIHSTAIGRCVDCGREWQAVIMLDDARNQRRGRQVP